MQNLPDGKENREMGDQEKRNGEEIKEKSSATPPKKRGLSKKLFVGLIKLAVPVVVLFIIAYMVKPKLVQPYVPVTPVTKQITASLDTARSKVLNLANDNSKSAKSTKKKDEVRYNFTSYQQSVYDAAVKKNGKKPPRSYIHALLKCQQDIKLSDGNSVDEVPVCPTGSLGCTFFADISYVPHGKKYIAKY
jgi:hypothetical protein